MHFLAFVFLTGANSMFWLFSRLIKEFERVMKEEESRNTRETVKVINDKKQSMVLFHKFI